MKLSEIARYWAAKELTKIRRSEVGIAMNAPFATGRFTLRVTSAEDAVPPLTLNGKPAALERVSIASKLKPGALMRDGKTAVLCFNLPKGESTIAF